MNNDMAKTYMETTMTLKEIIEELVCIDHPRKYEVFLISIGWPNEDGYDPHSMKPKEEPV